MKTRSVFSTHLDPYRAGVQLAEKLADIDPEVIILFSTIHYSESPELLEAIYDVLENDELVILGTTGDGFYESNKIADVGVSALGINSEKKVQWLLEYETGLIENTSLVMEKCIERIHKKTAPEKPDLWLLFADFRANSEELIKVINKHIDVPLVGGYAGDSNLEIKKCKVYAGKKVLTDGVALLGIKGDILYDINVAHDLTPVGKTGVVTQVEDKKVLTINNTTAMEFIEKELGKPLNVVDHGIITFNLIDHKDREQKTIRSLRSNSENGSVMLFGSVDKNKDIQVCIANPEDIIKEVKTIGVKIKDISFDPKAAIIISCAGRKYLLGYRIEHEVNEIKKGLNKDAAIVGFPSFGEIGPMKTKKGYTPTLFHNMTYILLLIGE